MQTTHIECDRVTPSGNSSLSNGVAESEPVIDATGIGINSVWGTQQVFLQAYPPEY
ncbi:hypothetical protein [Pantoea rodasii]|uniref:hypothetical protein n=1 Tax=Pantoea rodasii TaxID=1076549 RepID=UPI001B808A34|nr:hypothetical protein [Pantoea rodasii]